MGKAATGGVEDERLKRRKGAVDHPLKIHSPLYSRSKGLVRADPFRVARDAAEEGICFKFVFMLEFQSRTLNDILPTKIGSCGLYSIDME